MPWHHIIPKHEWKKRFGNLKGINARDNQVNLSLENHEQIHRRYGEEGSKFDRLAAAAMSGQIGKEEIIREACRLSGKLSRGRLQTPETRRKKSEALTGKSRTAFSLEHLQNLSISHEGNMHSKETRENMSQKRRNKKQVLVSCPHCCKDGGVSLLTRYHFDNCKKKVAL